MGHSEALRVAGVEVRLPLGPPAVTVTPSVPLGSEMNSNQGLNVLNQSLSDKSTSHLPLVYTFSHFEPARSVRSLFVFYLIRPLFNHLSSLRAESLCVMLHKPTQTMKSVGGRKENGRQ